MSLFKILLVVIIEIIERFVNKIFSVWIVMEGWIPFEIYKIATGIQKCHMKLLNFENWIWNS